MTLFPFSRFAAAQIAEHIRARTHFQISTHWMDQSTSLLDCSNDTFPLRRLNEYFFIMFLAKEIRTLSIVFFAKISIKFFTTSFLYNLHSNEFLSLKLNNLHVAKIIKATE